MSLLGRKNEEGAGGRLALCLDAAKASGEAGEEINRRIVAAIGRHVRDLALGQELEKPLDYETTERIWQEVLAAGPWFSNGAG